MAAKLYSQKLNHLMNRISLLGPVAYLGFCEWGGRAKDGRFEAPEAPMKWSVGRDLPSPLKKGFGEGAVPPPQKLKKNFGSMCSKNFCIHTRGGHRPVAPLNTPLIRAMYKQVYLTM